MGSEYLQNALFHDEVAPLYDVHLTNSVYDLLAREAFVELVTRSVTPGATLLDFGCGTGTDAFEYVQRGYRVQAYDNSPGMVAQLGLRFKAEIASGQIAAWSEPYPSFLIRFPQSPAPSAVVANFAVLNSIRELAPLFDTFARHLAPPGWIIVNILNPLHWSKLKTPRWWLKALKEDNGSPVYTAQPYVTYMHFLPALLRAAPQFRLVGRANSGMFVRYDAAIPANESRLWWGRIDSNRKRLWRALWLTPVSPLLGHFMFLVLRRDT